MFSSPVGMKGNSMQQSSKLAMHQMTAALPRVYNCLRMAVWHKSEKPLISAGLEKLFMNLHRSLQQQHMTNTRPVLIVGAGPTGMTAAIELNRFGISVRLIDKLLEPATTSRAGAHA